ncbi:restriction endonuclease subunit S [Acinetobacter variabilis]|uniref:Restriction endonuclease subunit S n=1 Tax=Acinetobacter variabilis TaxID=70346 RepID=A0A7T7WJE6_9GAMM|nr:restriction endonuclease subunit S [Acinetobacter variabilis]QQN88742.1 restriction endonuclease subunit S [Acinetobacter variabilis]
MPTPKLRFKEFNGDWTNKKIGDIAAKVGSGSTPRGGAEAYTDTGIIFIRSQNVNNDRLLLDDTVYIPESTHLKMSGSKVVANDILLNITGASIGRSCVVPSDFTEANVNQHVCIIRTPNDDPVFVQSFLSSENGQNSIQSKQAGGGREGLNFQAIRSIDFHFPPSKEEQTKIASFLSNVDEKISQLTQKHALLSQYKQGMMQKLFSQEIRFKADDGSEFGEWGNLKIFDLAKDKTLNNGVFNDQNKVGKGYKLINVLDMYIHRDIDESRLKLLDLSKKEFETNKVYYGDIFFTRSSLVKEGIAFSNVYLGNSNDVTYDGHLIKLTPDLDRVSPIFLNYVLKTNAVRKQLIKGGKTATMTTIGQQEVGNTMVPLPCLEEQTKIANFLSAIDQKIEVVAQQIEQAKQWKKGLLQQMFV